METTKQPQQVLFVHGAGDDVWQWSVPMIDVLKEHLGEAYAVLFPKMPHPENPKHTLWAAALQKEFLRLGNDAIVVGHSLGASTLLKYFSEANPPPRYKALFLLAAPYWKDAGWDASEFALRDDTPTLANDVPVFIYHNADDADVPFAHHQRYQALLPRARVKTGTHGGHAMLNLLPDVAKEIRSLA